MPEKTPTVTEIRRILPGELDLAARLWRDVFGDGREFVAEFCCAAEAFSGRAHTGIWAAFDGDSLLSMASLVPSLRRENGRERPCPYVFAVATEPRFRGRGLAPAVVSAAVGGDETCLIPASGALFDYWRAQGFEHPLCSRYPAPSPLPAGARPFAGNERDMYALYLEDVGNADAIVKPEGFFAMTAREWLRGGCVYSAGDGFAVWREGVLYAGALFAPASPTKLKGLLRAPSAPAAALELNDMFEY